MYLQTDSRWAKENMDSVLYTLGRWGCTDTSISNGRLSLAMPALNPKELSDKIKFTQDGLVLWSSLKNVGLELNGYFRFWNKERAKLALKSKDEFCLVELEGWHWALLWGTTLGVKIYDPLYGLRFMYPRYKTITKTVILKRI